MVSSKVDYAILRLTQDAPAGVVVLVLALVGFVAARGAEHSPH